MLGIETFTISAKIRTKKIINMTSKLLLNNSFKKFRYDGKNTNRSITFLSVT